MNTETSPVDDILRLLWSGEPEKAKALLEDERERVKSIIEQNQQVLALLEQLLRQAERASAPESENSAPPRLKKKVVIRKRPTTTQKSRRQREVLRIAKSVASRKQEFTTDDVREAVDEAGIDMGVSENRINTAIANIIKRAGKYERVAKGVYRLPKSQLSINTEPGGGK